MRLRGTTRAVVESFCPGMRESMFGNANVAVTGVAETLTTASEEQEQQQQQQQTEGDHMVTKCWFDFKTRILRELFHMN